MRRTLFVPIAIVALLAGCGSTTDESASTTSPAPEQTSPPEPDVAGPDSTEPSPTVPASTEPDSTEPDSTEPDVTEPTAPPRGVDDDTVRVGFVVIVNQAAASEQAGAGGITTIEQDAAVQLLVDDVNARGGLDGRSVDPVLFEIDATAGVDQQTIVRQFCATFTEDEEVYAVLSAGELGAEQLACLDAAGVPAIVAGGPITFYDDDVYETSPLLVNVSGLSLDAIAESLVAGLVTADWFGDGATVGVLRLQDAAFDAATERSLIPALEAAGVSVAEEVAIAAIASQDDIGRVSTEAQSAVLRMKDAGVDHLLFFESGGALPFFFLTAASGQDFAPSLAFTSSSGGQTLVDNVGTGGTTIGWAPLQDLPTEGQPEAPAAATACFDLLDPTGAAFVTPTAASQAASFCDVVRLLETAVGAAGLVDGAGLVRAIEDLGDGFEAASAELVSFGPDKRFGVAAYRISQYDAACGCNVLLPGELQLVGR